MIQNFPVYCSRQGITYFIERYELVKRITDVPGDIVECGVGPGFGLFSFYHAATILEPLNFNRNIIGFDTFEGFPSISDEDMPKERPFNVKVPGGNKYETYNLLLQANTIHQINRPLPHINKMQLVKGDICETAKHYLEENPHCCISLLYIDVDLYDPTCEIIDTFYDRVPKGGVIAFDEFHSSSWVGETAACHKKLKIGNLHLKRLPMSTEVAYAIKE